VRIPALVFGLAEDRRAITEVPPLAKASTRRRLPKMCPAELTLKGSTTGL
jgi:hypothetical protein